MKEIEGEEERRKTKHVHIKHLLYIADVECVSLDVAKKKENKAYTIYFLISSNSGL